MARPMKPLVKSGGYYPSRRWTPLVYPGGYTTMNSAGNQPTPIEKTVSGSLIHITDALALPAKALSVNISPIQDLHGYDSPWPAGGGKNKLPNTAQSATVNNVQYIVNAVDGSITANGTSNGWTGLAIGQCTLPAGTWYLESGVTSEYADYYLEAQIGGTNYSTNVAGGRRQFVLSAETIVSVKLYVRSGATVTNAICYPMIRAESAGTAYAPYSNICPITGWTGANVTRTGVNVWDEETESGAISASMGTPFANSSFTRSKNFCPIKPGLTYFRGAGTVADCALFFYRKDKSYIGVKYLGTVQTFDAPADAYFFKLHFRGTAYGNNISINYPATDTSYHAYSGATYSITFPSAAGTVYGGTLDVTTGKLTVDRAMIDCASITTWSTDTRSKRIYTVMSELAPASAATVVADGLICNRFKSISAHQIYVNVEGVAISTGSALQFRINGLTDTPDVTLANVNSYFTANETKVVAKLATPIVYDLTPTEVSTLLGTNNVWSDGEMTLVYLADGNASDAEALGILLGGRYTPSDDVTDKEALGIILGGTE